jgi:processive 1,2-diacylglycerol beta-glucosyltransferase
MCGRNEELKNRLEKEAKSADGARIIPVGYTKEMNEYMTAADLIVGKPGGLTTCEALAKGLVFVVVNPIPGQEERNADHLLVNGAAIRSNNPATLGYKIEQLLKDPKKLEKMSRDAQAFARPRAAFDIADKLAGLSRT